MRLVILGVLLAGCARQAAPPRRPARPALATCTDPPGELPARPDDAALASLTDGGPTCRAALEAMLRRTLARWHAFALEHDDGLAMATTDVLYERYFASFPDSDLHAQHGDLLWTMAERGYAGNWTRAAEAYARAAIALASPEQRDGRRRAIDASTRAFANALAIAEPAPRSSRLLALYLAYLRDAPAYPETVALLLPAAVLAARSERHADAARLYGKLIDAAPDDENAELAAQGLLGTLARLERYDELSAWILRLGDEPRFAALRARLTLLPRLYQQAQHKRAERLAEAGDYAACARTYEALAVRPDTTSADQVYYNAAMCHHNAGSHADAERNLRELVRRFPQSPLRARAAARLAKP